jgi:hypothetical protein
VGPMLNKTYAAISFQLLPRPFALDHRNHRR